MEKESPLPKATELMTENTTVLLENLTQSTDYVFSVSANTENGKGPAATYDTTLKAGILIMSTLFLDKLVLNINFILTLFLHKYVLFLFFILQKIA